MLQTMMSIGHKVEGNEKIGKTIIFARNHEHADFIKKRFRASYPHYHDTFAEIIDNYAPDAERLIDLFKELFLRLFNKYHDQGVAGVFSKEADKVLSLVEETNRRALA